MNFGSKVEKDDQKVVLQLACCVLAFTRTTVED